MLTALDPLVPHPQRQPDGARMNPKEYVRLAKKTDLDTYQSVVVRAESERVLRILHAAIGLSTEANEILDNLKKHMFYGKELDEINLKEELGDVFWYCALMADTLGVDFTSIMETNIAKLKQRYGDKFSSERAINRNLDAERTVLKG